MFILPAIFWRQQISWSYCTGSRRFGLVEWCSTNKKVTFPGKCWPSSSVMVVCYSCYANGLWFDSRLADFCFVFFFAFIQAPFRDNTNWRAGGPGGLEGRVSKWKRWIFGGLAGCCTQDRGAGRRDAQIRRSIGLRKRAGRTAEKGSPPAHPFPQPSLMFSPPDCLNVQPTCPSCGAACRPALFLCSSPARGKFMFFIWQHSPPGPQFSVIHV